MIIKIEDDFDLKKIADSGQCFRFNECGEGFNVVAQDKYLFVKKIGENEYDFSCSESDYEEFWKGYFDLDTDYRKIRGLIDKNEDEYLYCASEFGKGIRILKQDPWEMLISFIISQRKNIPAIKASIEKICALAGRVIAKDPLGNDVYSFPTPDELVKVKLEELSACSLGYRDKYVQAAAMDVASKAVKLEEWHD